LSDDVIASVESGEFAAVVMRGIRRAPVSDGADKFAEIELPDFAQMSLSDILMAVENVAAATPVPSGTSDYVRANMCQAGMYVAIANAGWFRLILFGVARRGGAGKIQCSCDVSNATGNEWSYAR
jgi:hypothetical protein